MFKDPKFWAGLGERALKTAAQALITALALGESIGFDVLAVDWKGALSFAGGAAILSVLTSLAFSTNVPLTNQPEDDPA